MRITFVGAVANCILTIAKIAAGIVGHSTAMVADGVHSCSDLISDLIVMIFVRLSAKDSDDEHNYGHGKFETLATLIVSLLLLIVGIRLLISGINSIYKYLNNEELSQPSMIALWMAILSIIVKEILYHVTVRVGRKVESRAVIANAWHHRTDAISSVGSLAGIGGAIFLGKHWAVLDPLACCIISIFIFFIAIKMTMTAINELMEVSLPDTDEKEITTLIESVDGIRNVHNLKTRRNGRSVIIDVHIVVNPQMTVWEAHEKTVKAESLLKTRFGETSHIFIHIEPTMTAL